MPKRSHLQSPNPVKHQMVAPEDLVVDETVAEVELIVQVAENMEAQDVADAAAAEEVSTALPVTPPRNAEPTYIYVYMPPKRSHLQFPNPVKQEMVAPEHLVVDEAVAEVELIVQVAENMEALDNSLSHVRHRIVQSLDNAHAIEEAATEPSSAELTANPKLKTLFNFQGIVLVVLPVLSHPLRRQILIGNGSGTVGVTVCGNHVNAFVSTTVGQMVHFTAVSFVPGKMIRRLKGHGHCTLELTKASNMMFIDGDGHFAHAWWTELMHEPPLEARMVREIADNAIVSVCGILSNVEVVHDGIKDVLILTLMDRTGTITARTQHHSSALFQTKLDQPILLSRVRVISCGVYRPRVELLDGSGTVMQECDAATAEDLDRFWKDFLAEVDQ